MHLETDQALFNGRSRLPLPLSLRCFIVISGLSILIFTQSFKTIGAVAAFTIVMMALERVHIIRAILPLIFLFNLTLLTIVWKVLGLDAWVMVLPLFKAFSATCLLSWFGGTVSWLIIKQSYLARNQARKAAEFIDYGLFHGQLLLTLTAKRFEAAFIRIGNRYKWPQPVAMALAGGVASAFERSIVIEEARYLRQPRLETLRFSPMSGLSTSPSEKNEHSTIILEANGLVVDAKDGARLLTRINFSLTKGEWLYIAGPSGSGKTTLLRAICGLQAIFSGEVLVCGTPRRLWKSHPSIGLVFQNPDDQFFATTPREDLHWGLRNRGVAVEGADSLIEEALTRLGVHHLIDRPLSQLSFGEKKRVAIAGILVTKPQIILCDEPTSGLDPVASRRLIETLERATEHQKTTVLWVSHDLHLIPQKVTQALLLNRGHQIAFCHPNVAFLRENLQLAGLL